jgi:DNA sulfur modification protein DndB
MKAKGLFPPISLPAMRAKMGDRWYYSATMTFGDVANCVQPVDKIHEKAELKTWIQRQLRPERTQQIVDYLRSQSERFFNAIVLGVYDGGPEWSQVDIEENLRIKGYTLGEREMHAFGIIRLSGEESIFAIDGQHRVEGIRAAVALHAHLAEEEQAVIFIQHKTTAKGRERTRRLFSTLNGYARPVPESELVALSEDNAFAIVTRRMIDEYPGLNMRFVPLLPSANIPPQEKTCLTTVVGLYQLTQLLAPLEILRAKKKHKIGPASKQVVGEIFHCTSHFWDALKKHVGPIRSVLASNPSDKLASRYRHENGGHILFRTVGLAAFARATRTMMDRGKTANRAVKVLVKVPLELDHQLWHGVLWRSETKTMLHKYVRLAQNILLHKAGEAPDGRNYSLRDEYFRITGRQYPN